MAIYLITGTPGAGKTLNTIREVHQRAQKEGRLVYYANIPMRFANTDMDFKNWREMGNPETADLTTKSRLIAGITRLTGLYC